MYDALEPLLYPASIAVLGASRDPRKWGQRVIRYSRAAGFQGPIFAVNPHATEKDIPAATVIPDVADASVPVSCAFLALPRDQVLASVERCCTTGVKTIVVAASGFGESSESGEVIERQILQIARGAGTRVVGPNCFGVFSASGRVNLTPFEYVPPGRVALASQSGNIAAELFLVGRRLGIGFSHCVGVGNQLDVGFGDLLGAYAQDPASDVVALYVEGLADDDRERFLGGLQMCREAGKPVVVIKAGASSAAAAVARTHTRSMAADDRVWDAALRQLGAIRVSSVSEMSDVLVCALHPTRLGRRVAIVTDGGGDSVLATDSLAGTRLEQATFSPDTIKRLAGLIPPAAPRSDGMNPLTLDTAGGVEDDPQILARCLEVIARDPGVDTVVVSGLFGTYSEVRSEELAAAEAMRRIIAEHPVGLVLHSPLDAAASEPLTLLAESGVPVFDSVDRALRAVERVAVNHGNEPGPDAAASHGRDRSPAQHAQLRVDDARELLESVGIETPPFKIVTDVEGLVSAAADLGLPLCIKTADPRVLHKSDVDGVFVDLDSDRAVEAVARRMWSVDPQQPLLVMPSYPRTFEFLVGGFSDPHFGPVVILGQGGVLTEIEADTVLVVRDFSRPAVEAALQGLRCYPALTGYRGRPELSIDSLCQLTAGMAELLAKHPTVTVDLNPVLLYVDRYVVADIRVVSPESNLCDALPNESRSLSHARSEESYRKS